MELNVTRVSLQLRHAILARNAQELEATLADIADKRKTIAGAMEGLGQGCSMTKVARRSCPCKAW